MTNLSQLIADLCAGLEEVETPSFSGFPETVSGEGNPQLTDKTGSFRSFQSFQSEDDTPGSDDTNRSENLDVLADAHAHASSYGLSPERPERPEIVDYHPLAEGVSLFPVRESETERPEREAAVAGVFPPPANPLPIAPADVRAGVARELRSLAEDGREGPVALRDAVEIVRAKIRNSETLAERQTHAGQCHVCGGGLDEARPVVAVLSWSRGGALYLHAGCHDGYRTRRAELVDRIMMAAGYGAETAGEAA